MSSKPQETPLQGGVASRTRQGFSILERHQKLKVFEVQKRAPPQTAAFKPRRAHRFFDKQERF